MNLRNLLIGLNLVLLFGYLTHSIWQKEDLLEDGQLVLLELAPKDPRSLMQGDYMRLDYAVARGRGRDVESKRGYVVVRLDENGVGEAIRYQPEVTPKAADEFLIGYQRKSWSLDIGAGSFFFQEGRANDFAAAKFGGLVVDEAGHSLLVGLYDEDRRLIE